MYHAHTTENLSVSELGKDTWGVAEDLPSCAESWDRLIGHGTRVAIGRVASGAARGLQQMGDHLLATGSHGVHSGHNPRPSQPQESYVPAPVVGRHSPAYFAGQGTTFAQAASLVAERAAATERSVADAALPYAA